MARGGRGGRGGRSAPDYNLLFDSLYSIQVFMPQGVLGSNFTFMGSQSGFITKVNNLSSNELQNIKQANIIILGQKYQSGSMLVKFLVMFASLLLIFPLFFLCCEWYKKRTEPSFQIAPQVYQSLSKFVTGCPQLSTLTLTVWDNRLNRQKFQILADMVSGGKLRGLVLANNALGFGLGEDQYGEFGGNGAVLRDACRGRDVSFSGVWLTSIIS